VVQRPDLAYAPAMPAAALAACPGARVLTLEEIATFLKEAIGDS
jgi:two-component system chemotaxis response regulator CheB